MSGLEGIMNKEDLSTDTKFKVGNGGMVLFWRDSGILTFATLGDLLVIQLRSALDPKRHYKKSDSKSKTLPKYFQASRLTKKERKETLANELLADHSLTKYRKRKIREIEEQKRPAGVEKWKTRVASHGSVRRTVGINEKSALFTFSERTVFVGSRDSYSVWFLKQFPGREPKNLVSHKHTEYTPK
ncbi:hypothetical protein IFM89_035999 [Coptis chinensis]|uniref:Fcf2 pre-rRNA processing C-terminal domain-containing protein n=1 Tax=Coptis chinensis TaxID=261450 RepID=A0A835M7X8_9MAGN|nr:hypothetical protein IFM89_035999 [Coptis chinensis]